MKYHSDDLIEQNCTDCGRKFEYIYQIGRTYGHRCPDCFRKVHTHNKIGSLLVGTCKDCGDHFSYSARQGRGPERCSKCTPTKLGTILTFQCEECSKNFSYTFKGHFFKICPECRDKKEKIV